MTAALEERLEGLDAERLEGAALVDGEVAQCARELGLDVDDDPGLPRSALWPAKSRGVGAGSGAGAGGVWRTLAAPCTAAAMSSFGLAKAQASGAQPREELGELGGRLRPRRVLLGGVHRPVENFMQDGHRHLPRVRRFRG